MPVKQAAVRTARILIQGQVQGIGFRPFVFRLAQDLAIKGSVANTKKGVVIFAQGARLKQFLTRLRTNPPPLAVIKTFNVTYLKKAPYKRFSIVKSRLTKEEPGVFVLPDLKMCPECEAELFSPADRRFAYPFINCTLCGPRYTIIEELPYDRIRTTMRQFPMCPECKNEYLDPLNRRYHAEPIACPRCGPQIKLLDRNAREIKTQGLIKFAARAIVAGKVVAIKGLGGFHLACDATSDRAVRWLRKKKGREGKPLALMVEDVATVRLICQVNPDAMALLNSPAAPIVLLPKKGAPALNLSQEIAPGNHLLGVMVAYTPLHRLLFSALREITGKPAVLVMTSANKKEEPIIARDKSLYEQLPGAFHLVLTHNRDIANRCDDSVVMFDRTGPVMVRRARGYAPGYFDTGKVFHVKHPTLALGADGRNTFALARGSRILLSPHLGDMDSWGGEEFFFATLKRLTNWSGITPEVLVCDLHPDYRTVQLAARLTREKGLTLYRVQHHYAHLLSVMVEHQVAPPALGIVCDGTGYGVDGAIWGCELILIQPDFSWVRLGHLGYLRHNAGAGMVADPVKVATAYCLQAGFDDQTLKRLGLNTAVPAGTMPVFTSSLGRLFDAVAAITGVCPRATYEGEAAVALEAAATAARRKWGRGSPVYKGLKAPEEILNPVPLLQTVVRERLAGTPVEEIALGFHLTVIEVLARSAAHLAKTHHVKNICLSGGSFQNHILRTGVARKLSAIGFNVFYNRSVPLNDGGLALGQAVAGNF